MPIVGLAHPFQSFCAVLYKKCTLYVRSDHLLRSARSPLTYYDLLGYVLFLFCIFGAYCSIWHEINV